MGVKFFVLTAMSAAVAVGLRATLPPDGFAVDGARPDTPWADLEKTAVVVSGNPRAARLADRSDSIWTVGVPERLGNGLTLVRKMSDRGTYRRWVYSLTASEPIRVDRLHFFNGVRGGDISGNTDGSVMLLNGRYYGVEHPMAKVVRRPIVEEKWCEDDYRRLSQTLELKDLLPGSTLSITFAYGSGSRRLDIASVSLVCDGSIVAEDVHAGYSGLAREANVYTLRVPDGVTEADLVARYVYVDGWDSEGTITVHSDGPGTVDGWLERGFEITPGECWEFSVVEGIYAPGQLRRAFQNYLEAERAHPYRVFPHYNSWFHLCIFTYGNADPLTRMTEEKCVKAIADVCDPLIRRGVTLDSYLWDDGWDEWDSLWDYHKGFPKGFLPLAEAAKARKGGIGAWLSPWGGYNHAAEMRRNYARRIGLPTNEQGLSLAQPKYFEAFSGRVLQMIRDYGMNLFKFDGIGGGMWATGTDAKTAPDLQGLFRLIALMRAESPEVFINCTVGTWPSPFWVLHADSIWRGGSDWDAVKGPGHLRERWITYRDDVIYNRFAKPCPLFPLNSVMMHGIIVSTCYGMPVSDKPEDIRAFADEVWMGVACGTDLQEYYVSPEMMSEKWWDILADGIRWIRANEAVLRDTHWVGGAPAGGEIYGYASWSPEKSIVALRNPSDKVQTWTMDLADILELPEGASIPKASGLAYASSGRPLESLLSDDGSVTLEPFETVVIEY